MCVRPVRDAELEQVAVIFDRKVEHKDAVELIERDTEREVEPVRDAELEQVAVIVD